MNLPWFFHHLLARSFTWQRWVSKRLTCLRPKPWYPWKSPWKKSYNQELLIRKALLKQWSFWKAIYIIVFGLSFLYTLGTRDICVETFQGLFNPETNREARILILENIFCWSSAPKAAKGQWTSDLVNGLVLSQWPYFLWTKISRPKLVALNPQPFRFFHFGGQKPEWCCTWPVSTSCCWENLILKDYLLGENDDEHHSKKGWRETPSSFESPTQKWCFSKTANVNISWNKNFSHPSETRPLCWQGHSLAPHLGSRKSPW